MTVESVISQSDCSLLNSFLFGCCNHTGFYVLGPVLYVLFVSPLFDSTKLINFSDDNFCVEGKSDLNALIVKLEMKLKMITKWLKGSRLFVMRARQRIGKCDFSKLQLYTRT